MKKSYFIILATLALLLSCKNKPTNLDSFMVNLSEFQINDTILKDGDRVRILGSSGNLTEEHEIDFYNLVVVRSEKTGDTINVLVTNFFQADLNNPYTRFISNTSVFGKILERNSDAEQLNGTNIKDLKPKSYNKVFYDTEF